MFNPDEVHRDAPALVAARSESFGVLASAVDRADQATGQPSRCPSSAGPSYTAWSSLIHGGARARYFTGLLPDPNG